MESSGRTGRTGGDGGGEAGRESRGRVFQAEGVLEWRPKVGREEQPLGAGSCCWSPAPGLQSEVPLRLSTHTTQTSQAGQPGDSDSTGLGAVD